MKENSSEQKFDQLRILIIEDDLIQMMSLELMLKQLGVRHIDRAETGEEAIRTVRESMPDLMLVDICLGPGISGIEAVHRIQQISPVPVIYITGNSDEKNRKLAGQTDYIEYLVKPVTLQNIRKLILKLEAKYS